MGKRAINRLAILNDARFDMIEGLWRLNTPRHGVRTIGTSLGKTIKAHQKALVRAGAFSIPLIRRK